MKMATKNLNALSIGKAMSHLKKADERLAQVIKKVGPCTLKPKRRQPIEALVSAVTHQQLNGTAAMTILKRVIALYPGKRFPAPADLLAGWMVDFVAAHQKNGENPPAPATEAQLRARRAAVEEVCGLWADRPESGLEIARRIRDANNRAA